MEETKRAGMRGMTQFLGKVHYIERKLKFGNSLESISFPSFTIFHSFINWLDFIGNIPVVNVPPVPSFARSSW
jgi:hypothetical protein